MNDLYPILAVDENGNEMEWNEMQMNHSLEKDWRDLFI